MYTVSGKFHFLQVFTWYFLLINLCFKISINKTQETCQKKENMLDYR